MSASPVLPFDLAAVRNNLVLGGLISPVSLLQLTEYVPTVLRRDPLRRWHYQVHAAEGPVCHLIAGVGLSDVRARAEALAGACPELICRPLLFWQGADEMDFLCLEHFEGESLDTLVEQGRCTAGDWLERVRHAQNLLEKTTQPSTEALILQEVDSVMEAVCRFPGFSEFDVRLIRELARPAVVAGARRAPLSRRWSNGDFAGRNLLVNGKGEMRLIDYEYAELTHFGRADWLRLLKFSTLPAGTNENAIPEFVNARQAWLEIHCWSHHLSLMKQVEPLEAVTRHVADTVSWLFGAIAHAATGDAENPEHSRLIALTAERHQRMDLMLYESATWAKSLERDLKSLREASRSAAPSETVTAPVAAAVEGLFPRDLAAKIAELKVSAGATLAAQQRAELAEAEVVRLRSAIDASRAKNEGQLEHAAKLQGKIAATATANEDLERLLREREHDLSRALLEFQATRKELTRYERHWLCRFFAKARRPK